MSCLILCGYVDEVVMVMLLSGSCGGNFVPNRLIQDLESVSWEWIPYSMFMHFQDPFSHVYLVRTESSRFH